MRPGLYLIGRIARQVETVTLRKFHLVGCLQHMYFLGAEYFAYMMELLWTSTSQIQPTNG